MNLQLFHDTHFLPANVNVKYEYSKPWTKECYSKLCTAETKSMHREKPERHVIRVLYISPQWISSAV